MKKILFTLFILLYFGCKKESLESTIIGKWELREFSDYGNRAFHSFPGGNGNTFTFTNLTFQQDTAGQYYDSGSYKLVKDLLAGGEPEDRLILKQNDNGPFISIENNVMTLIYPNIEPKIFIYKRIY